MGEARGHKWEKLEVIMGKARVHNGRGKRKT
jgi:hypothetical protein